MLTWLGVVCLVGAGAVVLHWVEHRVDALGRRRAFPPVWVLLLVVVAGALFTPWVLRMQLERRLGAAAGTLIGETVDVECQSFGQAFVDAGAELGYVRFLPDGTPEKSTLIKRSGCRSLSSYLRSDKGRPTMAEVVAVHTLSHEAMHMAGFTDEAETECAALRADARMAELLGASPPEALALALTYRTEVYPRMPAEYRSGDCGQ